MKHLVPVVVILLLVSTSFVGVGERDKVTLLEKENYNYDVYDKTEFSNSEQSHNLNINQFDYFAPKHGIESEAIIQSPIGLMNSSWPMYCHDKRHTSRSSYNTNDTWNEIWKFETRGPVEGGPVLADDGTIYAGAYSLYAIFPNGTMKWENDIHGWIESCPAVDENGTIYVGSVGSDKNCMYAINSDGTVIWKYPTGDIYSSPVIGDDGTMYFGDSESGKIKALFSNGTLKWEFPTNHVVYSSPAIGDDGIIYCGSHDTYIYAIYPNNGTLKWKYKTGDWIRTSPCIADDGTIYVVSLDNHLYAINPNGTLKWRTNMGEAGTSPTIGWDGTIYAGYNYLHAINPTNGSEKWKLKISGAMRGGTPCNSIEGTIYVGTHIGSYDDGEIIAIYSDGSLKFRKRIRTVESPPAIGVDGTVYIGSHGGEIDGFLHAFNLGELLADANGPYLGLIDKSLQVTGSFQGGYPPHAWFWDFGDGNISDEQNPTHIYTSPNNYTVALTVTDNSSNQSTDTTFAWIQESNSPPEKPTISGEIEGKIDTSYTYSVESIDPEGLHIWYVIDWGDGKDTGWIGPFKGEISKSHKWTEKGDYIIRCKAKDPYGAESEWGELRVTMPHTFWWLDGLLERFPLLQRLLEVLIR